MLNLRCACVLALAVPAIVAACSGAPGPEPKAVKTIADEWADLMVDRVGPTYETMLAEAELAPRDLDLTRVAASARALAATFGLGHGRLLHADIPEFADHSRWAEAWMLEIADAADAGDHAKVKQLVPREKEHCDACHRAASR